LKIITLCLIISERASAIEFSGEYKTTTSGEILLLRGQSIQSKQFFPSPVTVEAEMKTNGTSQCISMTLFDEITVTLGYRKTKWRFMPGGKEGGMGNASYWRKVKLDLDNNNRVHYYIDNIVNIEGEARYIRTAGQLQFDAGCQSMLIRNIKVSKAGKKIYYEIFNSK